MNIPSPRNDRLGSASKLTGVALSLSLLAAAPAAALDNASQLITGGINMSEFATELYIVPGTSRSYNADYPNTGLGEQSASVRVRNGTLSQLKVNVVTENAPSSGTFQVIVRKNGNDTELQCTVNAGGSSCGSGNKAVAVNNKTMLAIKIIHDLVGSGLTAFSYSLVYD